MHTKKIIIFISTILLIAGGYVLSTRPGTQESVDSPSESVPSIIGSWVWKGTVMNNDDRIIPAQAGAFTLTFNEDGSVSGTTDCNSIMGSYTMTEYGISFSEFAATKMFCENSQEAVFTAMVADATSVMFDEAGALVLLLKYDSGSVLFERM